MKSTPTPKVEIVNNGSTIWTSKGPNLPVLINTANRKATKLIEAKTHNVLVVNGYNEEGVRVSYHLNTSRISWV